MGAIIEAKQLTHTYSQGTPLVYTALQDVILQIGNWRD